nr:MAG TPA: hypothetical protein [Caudoviricetes sp.]
MIKTINGQTWFCCPECGKKIFDLYFGTDPEGEDDD